MNLVEFLEYPLPIIQIDIDKIAINTNEKSSGVISIKNIGGGVLSGEIVSNTDFLLLDRESFSGNDVKIEYSIAPSIYYNGDFIKSQIIIISNGGQVYIPVYITVSSFVYLECGKEKIHTIKEFYGYYLKNYIEAIRIFYSYEFMIWLKNINYKHIDVVEEILKDANKQRAIDNFFVLSKIKEKAYIQLSQKNFKYKYFTTNFDAEIIGIIPLKLIGTGYFEENITIEDDIDFIKISKDKITNKDFDDNGNYNLEFRILKNKITNFFERRKIIFNKAKESIIIEISKKNPLEILFEKDYFTTTDNGTLKILNNTEKDIIIEIVPKDTFVFFEGKKYLVSKYTEIGFNIRVTGFLKAQMDFTKKPNIESEILIKAILDDSVYKMQKKIYIGNSLI
ncbi:DUF5717 family protein [uncultured Tyzzerella sp.]|uniref:DUF5717 family protein n=1 Tax=uncultured Tyzzerella sp. TaxID=2321398 RepID=UPI002941EC2F|nr:DUF5717 family protein [uncultured Tyzzerella sp.]